VFELPEEPTASLTYRLVVRGTGETPLVGLAGNRPVAFAGRVGGPSGVAADGNDLVELIT